MIWSGDPFTVYSQAERVFIDGALVFDRSDSKRQDGYRLQSRYGGPRSGT